MNYYDPATIREGNALKRKAEETPTSFATEGGSSFSQPSGSLDQKNATRFAGPGGAYAMALQNDPNLAIRTQTWAGALQISWVQTLEKLL